VGDRLFVGDAAGEPALGGGGAHDRRGHGAEGDARLGDRAGFVESEHHGAVDDADGLRAAQAELEVGAAMQRAERRKGDVDEHFVRLQHGAAHAGIERGERQGAFGGAGAQRDGGVERDERRDRVVGGRRGDEVAGDGAAIADLRGADFAARLGERARGDGAVGVGGDVAVRDERAEVHDAVDDVDRIEIRQARDVDQRAGRARAAVEFDDEVRRAGDQTRVRRVRRQQFQRFVERDRFEIITPHRETL
jgi:hypothetical protein